MFKLTITVMALTLLATGVFAQKTKASGSAKQTMKTIRLHIDGFTKSKSGAV